MSNLIPINKIDGGELAAHFVSNGIEAIQNAVEYDNRIAAMDWSNYSRDYQQAISSLSNQVTMEQIYNTQQMLMQETSIRGSDWIYHIDTPEIMRAQAFKSMGYYILANPNVTKRVKDGTMVGYNLDYLTDIDDHPREYYEVIDGLRVEGMPHLFEMTNDGSTTSKVKAHGMRNLTIEEIVDILDTWNSSNMYISKGIDITDPDSDD